MFLRSLTLTVAAFLALTAVAEARDGGERRSAPAVPHLTADFVSGLHGRNAGRPIPETSALVALLQEDGLSGRNARFTSL